MVTPSYVFPVISTFEEAWQKVKGTKLTFFLLVLTIILTVVCVGILTVLFQDFVNPIAALIVSLAGDFLQLILMWGVIYFGIQRATGGPIFYAMVRNVFSLSLVGKMLGLYCLIFLIILIPMILPLLGFLLVNFVGDAAANHLIQALLSLLGGIIAFYLGMRLVAAKGIVINELKNPIDAIKISFAATKNNVWHIIGFVILQALALVLSIIPFGIGLIWSIPFCSIAYGLLYRKLVVLRTDLIV